MFKIIDSIILIIQKKKTMKILNILLLNREQKSP